MIKAVIFDCFGVLTVDLWKEFVGTLPEEQKLPARDMNHAYDGGAIGREEFMKQVQNLTGKNPVEVEAVRDSDGSKNKELLEYIAKLKSDYKIGLLSNIATNWVRETLLTHEEQALFDMMIFSYEVRMTKPDPRIFELACQRLGVDPEEAVMIDDINHYCETARSVGMQAVVYQNFAQMKTDLEKILDKG